jgi:hypothetical protein
MGWGHLKIFSRTSESILTRLGKKYSWIEEIQFFFSNEGDNPSPSRDNNESVKID